MPWSTDGRNAIATATTDAIAASVSLHDGDPGAAGTANEWSGGGYSRQVPAFAAASGGSRPLSAAMSFTGPALTSADYIGIWNSGGTFMGGFARTSGDAAANASGEYSLSTLPFDVPA